MNEIRFPQSPINGPDGYVSLEWQQWLLNPQYLTLFLGVALGVDSGGTGLTTGTSGGIIGFTGTETMESSDLLVAHALVLGGGAGDTPSTPVGLGTATTLLHGNATGDPTWGAVVLTTDVSGTLPVANGGTGLATLTDHALYVGNLTAPMSAIAVGTNNTFLRGVTGGDPSFGAAVLASADFANQGTATTVLHGNAAGNPAFGAVVAADAPTLVPYTGATDPLDLGTESLTAGVTVVETIETADPGAGAGVWRLGQADTVSPTAPNRTIEVEIDGVVYYLAGKTTND